MEVKDKLVKASSLQEVINSSELYFDDPGRKGTATTVGNFGFGKGLKEKIILRDANIYKIATIDTRIYAETMKLSGSYTNWFGANARWFWMVINFRGDVQGNFYMPYPRNDNISFRVYDDGSKYHVYMVSGEPYPCGNIDVEIFGNGGDWFETYNLNQSEVLSEEDIQGTLVWDSKNNFHELIASRDLTYATSSDIESIFGGGLNFLKKYLHSFFLVLRKEWKYGKTIRY